MYLHPRKERVRQWARLLILRLADANEDIASSLQHSVYLSLTKTRLPSAITSLLVVLPKILIASGLVRSSDLLRESKFCRLGISSRANSMLLDRLSAERSSRP